MAVLPSIERCSSACAMSAELGGAGIFSSSWKCYFHRLRCFPFPMGAFHFLLFFGHFGLLNFPENFFVVLYKSLWNLVHDDGFIMNPNFYLKLQICWPLWSKSNFAIDVSLYVGRTRGRNYPFFVSTQQQWTQRCLVPVKKIAHWRPSWTKIYEKLQFKTITNKYSLPVKEMITKSRTYINHSYANVL